VAQPGGDAPQPGGGFLPPEATGPTPQLGGPPPEAPVPPPPPAWQPQAPAWQPAPAWSQRPPEPDNTPAVIGFSLSLGSIGLLMLTGSFSTVVSLGLAIAGLVTSRRGRKLVQEGHTRKHKDLATAGFVVGIVGTVLSALATLFWIGILVLIIVDAGARHDVLNDQDAQPAVLGVTAALRVAGILLS
jgi:MFS family permease